MSADIVPRTDDMSRSLLIALISTDYPPLRTSAAVQLRDLAQQLAALGHRPVHPGALVVDDEEVDGQVKWYDPKKGFGFVAVEGSKDVFIHRSVLAREGINELAEGQRIHMKVVPGAKGLEAVGVSLSHD